MSRRLEKDRIAITEGRELVRRLREFKRRTGLSRKQLAELIGVSYPSVYYWTRGPTLPEKESRDKLRRFLERDEFG
jgi:transcriptional regulator with XRE-family HTH domain